MATFKIEIQNKRADGTYNVRIRVTHAREIRRLSTHLYVSDDDLTRGGNIKAPKVLKKCEELISQCYEACNGLDYEEIKTLSIDALVDRVRLYLQGGERFELDFIAYMKEKAAAMKKSTGDTYLNAVRALCRYRKCDTLDISEIDTSFLRGFEAFLINEPSQRGNNRKKAAGEIPGKGGRAVSKYLACVRAIHNTAKAEFNDEDKDVIRIPGAPFAKYKVRPQPATRKRALTVSQVQAIIDLPYTDSARYNFSKDCFILSFVLIGMNSADMYRVGKPSGGVLTYNRRKTEDRRTDKAEMSLQVDSCIAVLMEKYADSDRLFNFYRKYSNSANFNRALNVGLKQIGAAIGVEDLEFYAARHSWATIARSRGVGIDKYTVHEALNHVDEAMKVTDIYIARDWSVIWDANRRVLDLFDWTAIGYDLL